ncbi:MAG: DUF3500 domain-containing protein [Pirellulaceae bacterium]|nr:DUF3500 domain-containing protein [Pirellulaceae bacterium]
MRSWIAMAAVGLALLSIGRSAWERLTANQDAPASSLVMSAQAFGKSLDTAGKQKAMLPYSDKERVNWQFVPLPTRKGLPMMDMSAEQQDAARQLLKVAVSQIGFEKATKIMSLENVLRKLEGAQSHERRNPLKYYFTIYGTPGASEHWGMSIEGHHLSLNFVMQGDKIVDSTPQFFATNPAELKDNYGEGFEKGLRVLREEETLAFDLLATLKDEQRQAAMLPGETPKEIRAPSEAQPPQTPAAGVTAASLAAAQKEVLRKLLSAYTEKMRPEVAQSRWQLIDKAGFDKIAFAWSGADRPGVGHYYRIQGPTFLVEFINVQNDAAGNPANHIHCVWRDMEGDFDLPIRS